MIRALKLMIRVIIILGIVLSILNFISVENKAIGKIPIPGVQGTGQSNGLCMGEPLNC
jgi:hypothetical protein